MDRRDMGAGVFCLVVALFVVWRSGELGIGSVSEPGAGFLLFLTSLCLGGLSILLIATSVRKENRSIAELWRNVAWPKVLLAVIALLLYAVCLPVLGYLLCSFLLMVVFYSVGRFRTTTVLASAFATAAISYVIFQLLLKVRFPRGILGL